MQHQSEPDVTWLDRPISSVFRFTWETGFLILLLILAVISRFYLLDARVMSHDETIHVYHNSWSLYTGQGYRHDPLSHGPFQTHVVALSYFLFGDSDLTARIPAVLFGIATVGFIWFYRRYLGKAGMFIAMTMMVISPYMLYYGRYVRNEAFAAFAGVVLLWGMLRFLETGKDKYTYFVTLATVLHFTAKETAFIYTAQALLFLSGYFLYQIFKRQWIDQTRRTPFIIALSSGILILAVAELFLLSHSWATNPNAAQTVAPAVPGQSIQGLPAQGPSPLAIGFLTLGVICLLVAIYFLIKGFTWKRLGQERSFALMIILGTIVLPMLSAFPVYFVGWNVPTNASEVTALLPLDILHIGIFLVPFTIIAILIGLLWNWRLWLKNFALFYLPFTILYTTVFTNGAGFFTGLVGSLGYWLKQQGVQRGSQPWYYYILVQIPIYEYLPALASLLGFIYILFGKRPLLRYTDSYKENQAQREVKEDPVDQIAPLSSAPEKGELETPPTLALLGFWVISGILAFSAAGEKMPWLTVHVTWSMILLGGWALGYLVDTIDWSFFKRQRGLLMLLVLIIFIFSFAAALGSLLGTNPPFGGMQLGQLEATSTFVTSFLIALASGFILWKLVFPWSFSQFFRVVVLTIFAFGAVLTAHTAIQANYINYDDANELLVYAHSAGGVKDVMKQVEEISRRTTGGLALQVAFDGEYPFWWYLRNYPNSRYFGSTPSRSLRDVPVIIVGDGNFGKIEPVVGNAFDKFEYIRLWWPNQDYFNLTWERVWNAITNPQMRAALFQIWLNRDYTEYGKVTGKDMSLENWNPSTRMRLYIRKDILSKLWNYGSAPAAQEIQMDPYEGKLEMLSADQILGGPGTSPGQFQRPRDLALAADGTIYVADTDNHRIQHLSWDGTSLQTWGSFGDVSQGQADGGIFNQPWGIAVGRDGSVYVADTWNHRVQKFTADGKFISMWGYFGTGEAPQAFWGPRDIAVDSQGRLFVSDTGNKRIVVFDPDGNFITQFGSAGLGQGQFDEPVGLAVDSADRIYVVDTWNQRIQVFSEVDGAFIADRMWDVAAWYGQSLDNKPFIAVDADGDVFITDPEGYRVIQFDNEGSIIRYWGDYGTAADSFGLTGSVAVDSEGGVWVSDTGNSRLMHFIVP